MMSLQEVIQRWLSGEVLTDKAQEDLFMNTCSLYYTVKCNNNPGQIGEKEVKKMLKIFGCVEQKNSIKCTWLYNQEILKPDAVYDKFVVEVKTLRYYNGKGERGNQGTGVEKIDSVFRKYCGLYNTYGKKTIIVLCADMQHDRNGKAYIDAFCHGKYHGNRFIQAVHSLFKDEIYCIPYQLLTYEFLAMNKLL